jgi:hypothetical protein
MKILKLLTILLLIGIVPAFASPKRTEVKQLTYGGVNLNGYSIPNNNVVTSDSVYQSGNEGFLALATQIDASGAVGITYQVSYDNINWWTPYTTSGGTLTAAGTIATTMTANRWIISTAVLAPYMRFIYTATANSHITADTLWQDES